MMGTVWLRLHESQEYIQPFINAIVSNPLSLPSNDAHVCGSSSDPPL
jgi:hypothetical protein